jgi:hypothetical protein
MDAIKKKMVALRYDMISYVQEVQAFVFLVKK